MDKLAQILLKTARESGQVLKDNAFTAPEVEWKSPGDPVTELDRTVERKIKASLVSAGYNISFLGEEYGSSKTNSDYLGIIDPLDGTKSYLRGEFNSAVSIAISQGPEGQPIAGVVHDFMRDITYLASGHSVYLLHGEKPQKIPRRPNFGKITINIEKEYYKLRRPFEEHPDFEVIDKNGSIALNLAHLAIDVYDGMIIPPSNKGNVWDIAAGYYYLAMAGKEITDFHGNPFNMWERGNGFIALRQEVREKTLEVLAKAA
jgi:myo-inositol-1(or 4)-monophosphatase